MNEKKSEQLKLSKEKIFYLFVLDINRKKIDEVYLNISFFFIGNYHYVRNISSDFIYFSNSNQLVMNNIFYKSFNFLLKNELIECIDKNNVYFNLTNKGIKILEDLNLNTIEDLDEFIFEKRIISESYENRKWQFEILANLDRYKREIPKKILVNSICNSYSLIEKDLKDLIFNGMIDVKYRAKKLSINDTKKEKHELVKKYCYPSLVNSVNREIEYYIITEKGKTYKEELKNYLSSL